MRKLVLLLLLMLSIPLIAQELNELSIFGKAEKTNDIVSSSIKDVNNRKASCIIFLTDLDVDMDFKPNIELVKLISKAGRHEVYVQPGERVIEVLASGFKPFNLVLSSYGISKLESGDVYQVEITGEKTNNMIPVNFIIKPSNAEIFVDEISKGVANKILIPAGRHIFRISKEGYKTIEKEEYITINNTLLRFELSEQMYVAVSIKTTPKGATVYLDDTKATVTPKPFFYPEGNYTIRIEKESYETIEESITIRSPQTNKKYTLEDIRASLTIKTHPNATVYINDESYKGGVADLKLSPQIVQVRVEMPKAKTIKRVVTLKPKSKETFEIFPEVQTGTIQVAVIPTDAKIELIGDSGELFTSKGRKIFSDIPIGNYKLILSKNNYETNQIDINLKQDETKNYNIELNDGKNVYITSTPEGAKVFIDEIYTNQTPFKTVLSFNDHKFEFKKNNYITKTIRKSIKSSVNNIEVELIQNEVYKKELSNKFDDYFQLYKRDWLFSPFSLGYSNYGYGIKFPVVVNQRNILIDNNIKHYKLYYTCGFLDEISISFNENYRCYQFNVAKLGVGIIYFIKKMNSCLSFDFDIPFRPLLLNNFKYNGKKVLLGSSGSIDEEFYIIKTIDEIKGFTPFELRSTYITKIRNLECYIQGSFSYIFKTAHQRESSYMYYVSDLETWSIEGTNNWVGSIGEHPDSIKKNFITLEPWMIQLSISIELW